MSTDSPTPSQGSMSEPTPPEHPMRLRGGLLVTLGALAAFGPISLDVYLPAFSSIAATFGVAPSDIQITFSACLIGLGAGQLIYGPLSDRYGRKGPLLAGLALYVLASIMCVLAPNVAALTLGRLLMGLGGCAGLVMSRAIVRDCFSGPALARSFSIVGTAMTIAPLIAPTLGALLIEFFTWRATFIAMALFGAACLLATLALPETHPIHHRTDHGVIGALRGYMSLLGRGRFTTPALMAALSTSTLLTYISNSPVVLMDGYGMAPWVFALIFAAMSCFLILGMRINMRLVGRHSGGHLLVGYLSTGTASAMILALLLITHAPLPFVLFALGSVVACMGASYPLASAEAMQPFPRAAGAASALVGTLQFGIAGLMAALLVALPWPPAVEMGVSMLTLVATAALLSLIGRRQKSLTVRS